MGSLPLLQANCVVELMTEVNAKEDSPIMKEFDFHSLSRLNGERQALRRTDMSFERSRCTAFLISTVAVVAAILSGNATANFRPIWQAITSGGTHHTCALSSLGGEVFCWGRNSNGQLGSPLVPIGGNSNKPVKVQGLAGPVESISAGSDTTCAVLQGGIIQCWGSNEYGQLGNPQVNGSTNMPVKVEGLNSAAKTVVVGLLHACAALSTGGVSCWGTNSTAYTLGNGQVLLGAVERAAISVSGVTNAVGITAGTDSTCAIIESGSLRLPECWGDDSTGQEGVMEPAVGPILPTFDFAAPPDIAKISQANLYTCAISQSKGLLCWGTDVYFGQLGDNYACGNTPSGYCYTPQKVQLPSSPPVAISTGNATTCAVAADGSIYCWGNNDYGELGFGSLTPQTVGSPQLALTAQGATQIAVGYTHACAIVGSGYHIQCWGRNSQGELGDGTYNDSALPVSVF
jgi:alpha-tubulin suppressor-like RCC1 family protein